MSQLPAEIIEFIIDYLDDDRASLLSCSMIGRLWRARSLAHLFCILQVTQEPYSSDRWWSATPVAFIRVTVEEFARLLSAEFVHLVRFVVHLQVGDWMEDRKYDAAYSDFLTILRLPEGHTVERLSLFGRFCFRPEDLSRNFANVTMLRTHCAQYSDIGCFSACLAGLPALTLLQISGNDFSESRDPPAVPMSPSISPPALSAPCAFKLTMDTNAPALPDILHWVALAAPHIVGNVCITGYIPLHMDRWGHLVTEAPLGVLLDDTPSPGLRTVRELELTFDETALPDFARLLNHLPHVHTVRCRISFADICPRTLARLLTHQISAGTLRTLDISAECNFTHTAFLEKPWELLAVALGDGKWSGLRGLVLRLRKQGLVSRGLKEHLQSRMDTMFAGTKVAVLLEDDR